jgi:hypothetical protein
MVIHDNADNGVAVSIIDTVSVYATILSMVCAVTLALVASKKKTT